VTAVGYLRKSSAPSKRVRTVSFEVQEQEVRALAARNGDELGVLLSDWGKSGGSTKRPDYQRLLAMIEAGEVRTVYSFSLSRLSRSTIDFAELLERCKKHDVTIRLVQEGQVDHKTATGRAFAGMAALFAQFERELAAERNGAAAAERRERGDHLGQAPYGWRVVDGKLVERDDERPDLIADAFREARSFAGAAKLLNAWAVPTRRVGTKWNHSVVADILRQQGPADLQLAMGHPRARAKALGGALFAGLLGCPCGGVLTPRKDDGAPTGVSGYYCSRATREPHEKMHVAERPILEWAKVEAARLRTPERARLAETNAADRARIEQERTRIVDTFVAGHIDIADRDRRMAATAVALAALDAHEALVSVPALDWDGPPSQVNAILRTIWDGVELDQALRPVSARWAIREDWIA
jgi:DNA invertase Pin-like site-specific DNA recombinase